MGSRALDVNDPFFPINTIDDSVLVTQSIGITPRKIAHQLFSLERVPDNYFHWNAKRGNEKGYAVFDVTLCRAYEL